MILIDMASYIEKDAVDHRPIQGVLQKKKEIHPHSGNEKEIYPAAVKMKSHLEMCVAIGREASRAFQTSSTGRFSLATSSKMPVREQQTISGLEVVEGSWVLLLARNDPVGGIRFCIQQAWQGIGDVGWPWHFFFL